MKGNKKGLLLKSTNRSTNLKYPFVNSIIKGYI